MYNIKDTNIYNIVSASIKKSFGLMAIGLFITFAIVFSFARNIEYLHIAYKYFRIIIILELVIGFVLSLAIYRLNAIISTLLFLAYSALNGVMLSGIGVYYGMPLILNVLATTTVIFLVLAIYGYTTKSDLSSYSTYLFVGLIALIVMSVINLFLRTPIMDIIISSLGVIIFTILIAFDTQRIKENISIAVYNGNDELLNKIIVVGAFSFYLDFINLFIYLLRLFSRRDD